MYVIEIYFELLNLFSELIQQVVALKKPVILDINHDLNYKYWVSVLKPNKQYNDTKVLRDFALAHNISGFIIGDAYPFYVSICLLNISYLLFNSIYNTIGFMCLYSTCNF
jgi:hypothetical protein